MFLVFSACDNWNTGTPRRTGGAGASFAGQPETGERYSETNAAGVSQAITVDDRFRWLVDRFFPDDGPCPQDLQTEVLCRIGIYEEPRSGNSIDFVYEQTPWLTLAEPPNMRRRGVVYVVVNGDGFGYINVGRLDPRGCGVVGSSLRMQLWGGSEILELNMSLALQPRATWLRIPYHGKPILGYDTDEHYSDD